MSSPKTFWFVFNDVGFGTGGCSVEIREEAPDRFTVVLSESGNTRYGSVENAFAWIATRLRRKHLSHVLVDQISWLYRRQDTCSPVALSWDGQRFWKRRMASKAGLDPMTSNAS